MVGPGPTEDTYEAASIAALDGPGGVMDSSTLTSTSQNGKQRLRLFNPQLSMNEREKISESLLTGIKVQFLAPVLLLSAHYSHLHVQLQHTGLPSQSEVSVSIRSLMSDPTACVCPA